jgi:hypothetical protein
MVFRSSEGPDRYDSLVVVAVGGGEAPLLLWGTRWAPPTLARLWSALGVTPTDATDWKAPVTFRKVTADNAHLGLPWSWRRPWATAIATFAGLLAYVVVTVIAFALTVPNP